MAANRTRSLRPDQRLMHNSPFSLSHSSQSLHALPPRSRGQISATLAASPQHSVPAVVRRSQRGDSLSRQKSVTEEEKRCLPQFGAKIPGEGLGGAQGGARGDYSGKKDGSRTDFVKENKKHWPSESIFTVNDAKRASVLRPEVALPVGLSDSKTMSRARLQLPPSTSHSFLRRHLPLAKKECSDSLASQSTIDTPSHSLHPLFLFGNSDSPRVVGLRNFGNNCYMNAMVQCLNATPGFAQALAAGKQEINREAKTRGRLAEVLFALISEMQHGKKAPLNVAEVKAVISTVSRQFLTYEQHDAHEFLRCLLDALHEDLNRVRGRLPPRKLSHTVADDTKLNELAAEWWADCTQRSASQVTDMFRGQLLSIVTCSVCGNSRYTFEEFLDLSLALPTERGGASLQQCLDEFTAEKELEGVKCKVCRTERLCYARTAVYRYPRVLVVHLKRFSVCGEMEVKINASVSYPLSALDLTRHTIPSPLQSETPPIYDLFAVSHHFGAADFGHYYAYAPHSDCQLPESSQWFTFDDTRVSQLFRPSEASRTGYVLFYSLRGRQ